MRPLLTDNEYAIALRCLGSQPNGLASLTPKLVKRLAQEARYTWVIVARSGVFTGHALTMIGACRAVESWHAQHGDSVSVTILTNA